MTPETLVREKRDPGFFQREYLDPESHETQCGVNHFAEPHRLCSRTEDPYDAPEVRAGAVSDAELPEVFSKP
jgi:hypothetical protein